jgi:hypothetical protein
VYYAIVAALMFVFPLLSIAIEHQAVSAPLSAELIAKWFVFWAVGWRLLLAGTRQIAQPQYTAKEILGLKSDESLILVRELGFANVATGLLGVLSLLQPAWQLGAALAGGVYYGLAGVSHAFQRNRNRLEDVAMVSDLFASAVLLGACGIATLSK